MFGYRADFGLEAWQDESRSRRGKGSRSCSATRSGVGRLRVSETLKALTQKFVFVVQTLRSCGVLGA